MQINTWNQLRNHVRKLFIGKNLLSFCSAPSHTKGSISDIYMWHCDSLGWQKGSFSKWGFSFPFVGLEYQKEVIPIIFYPLSWLRGPAAQCAAVLDMPSCCDLMRPWTPSSNTCRAVFKMQAALAKLYHSNDTKSCRFAQSFKSFSNAVQQ